MKQTAKLLLESQIIASAGFKLLYLFRLLPTCVFFQQRIPIV